MYKSGSTPELESNADLNVSAFGEDEDGELYVVGYGDDTVRRLPGRMGLAPI